ncbi:hypothetical protein C8R46DRAFT_1304263, partial [Mycena filopes]
LQPLIRKSVAFYSAHFTEPLRKRKTQPSSAHAVAFLERLQDSQPSDSDSDSSLDSSLSNMSWSNGVQVAPEKPKLATVVANASPEPDIPPFDSWALSPMRSGVLYRSTPLLALELPSPSGIEEELSGFNGSYPGDLDLLPAFELHSTRAKPPTPAPGPSTESRTISAAAGTYKVDSSPALENVSDMDVDNYDLLLDFDHLRTPEKSPSSAGALRSSRRPLTPRNSTSRVSLVASMKGKGKEREEFW